MKWPMNSKDDQIESSFQGLIDHAVDFFYRDKLAYKFILKIQFQYSLWYCNGTVQLRYDNLTQEKVF